VHPSSNAQHNACATALDELRRAIDDSDCELYRPSELLAVTLDLYPLRDDDAFKQLIEDQLRRDFKWDSEEPDPSEPDPWLTQRLSTVQKQQCPRPGSDRTASQRTS
jgi:hypothetical protein